MSDDLDRTSAGGFTDEQVYALGEEFLARLRKGESPTVDEYARQHPQWADQIRELFPAMMMVEDLKPASHDLTETDSSQRGQGKDDVPQRLGDFRILREIGRGGMGIVYEAEQESLGRHVALKVLPQSSILGGKQRKRFEREARAVARLHHTNIVPIFGVGEVEGISYYVMQFINGRPLNDVMAELRRQAPQHSGSDIPDIVPSAREDSDYKSVARDRLRPPQEALKDATVSFVANSLLSGQFQAKEVVTARPAGSSANAAKKPDTPAPAPDASASFTTDSLSLSSSSGATTSKAHTRARHGDYFVSVARVGAQVAGALQHAFEQNILHRDIKPANLILDLQGTVWVTDFGLAKLNEGPGVTQTGDVVGTLRYMSPEALDGETDVRSDIYSLGLTLYELLVLRPAHDAKDRARLVHQITQESPPTLRSLNPHIPRDLETIILKSIAREPKDRYQTPGDMAADLERFLADEPIKARRASIVERLVRWSRHNRGLAAALAVILVMLIALNIAGPVITLKLNRLYQESVTAQRDAESARAQTELMLTDMHASRGVMAMDLDDPNTGLLWFAEAARLSANAPDRQKTYAVRANNTLDAAILPIAVLTDPRSVEKLSFRPGGDMLLIHYGSRQVAIWDWVHQKQLAWPAELHSITDALWLRDGEWLALSYETGHVEIWEAGGEMIDRFKLANGEAGPLALSPDGRQLAMATDGVRIWDTTTKKLREPSWYAGGRVTAMRFNRRGDRLVAASGNQARVFDVGPASTSNAALFVPVAHLDAERGVAPVFVDDDKGLVTLTATNALGWWDAATGRSIRALNPEGWNLTRLAASPDGRWFAAGGYYGPYIWDATRPEAPPMDVKHTNRVGDIAFSSDSQSLLSISNDRAGRLTSLPDGLPLGSPMRHFANGYRCAIADDSVQIATVSDGLIRIWRAPHSRLITARGHNHGYRQRISHDGRLVSPGIPHQLPIRISNVASSVLTVLDSQTGETVGVDVPMYGSELIDSAIASDNKTVVTVTTTNRGGRGWFSAHKFLDGQRLYAPVALPGRPLSVDVRPTHTQAAVLCSNGAIWVIDIATGKRLHQIDARHTNWSTDMGHWARVQYAPDGKTLLALTNANQTALHLLDADSGKSLGPPIEPVLEGGPCRNFAVSADSRLVATVVNGRNALQVWDLQTGRKLCDPIPHPGDSFGIFGVAFSADGSKILTGGKDAQARLWDWKSGKLACPPMDHPDEIWDCAISADGHGITAGRDGMLRLWDLSTGKMMAPPLQAARQKKRRVTDTSVTSITLTPDGKRAWAPHFPQGDSVQVSLEPLASPGPLDPSAAIELAAIVAGSQLDQGELSGMSTDQWVRKWTAFSQRHPSYEPYPPHQRLHALMTAAETEIDAKRPEGVLPLLRVALDIAGTIKEPAPMLQAKLRIHTQRMSAYQILNRTAEVEQEMAHVRTTLESLRELQPGDVSVTRRLTWLLLSSYAMRSESWSPTEARSEGGATLRVLPDGWIQAQGVNPPVDRYLLSGPIPEAGITAIKLEFEEDEERAETDASGRGPDGTFKLTEAGTSRLSNGQSTPVSLEWAAGISFFGLSSPRLSIDGDEKTVWESDELLGAVPAYFQLAESIKPAPNDAFRIEMSFAPGHAMGRFRVRVLTGPEPIAASLLSEAIARNEVSDPVVALGLAYFAAGEFDKSLPLLESARSSDNPVTLLTLALANQRLGRAQPAREHYDRALKLIGDGTMDRSTASLAGVAMRRIEGLTTAAAEARVVHLNRNAPTVTGRTDDSAEAVMELMLRVVFLMMKNDTAAAIPLLEGYLKPHRQNLRSTEDIASAADLLQSLYMITGATDKAATIGLQLALADPKDTEQWMKTARSLRWSGRQQELAQLSRAILDVAGGSADGPLIALAARCASMASDVPELLEPTARLAAKALSQSPNDEGRRIIAGLAEFRAGRLIEADTLLAVLAESGNQLHRGQAEIIRAMCAFKRGERDPAVELLQTAESTLGLIALVAVDSPYFADETQLDAWLLLREARTMLQVTRSPTTVDQVLEYFRQAAAKAPEDTYLSMRLAAVLHWYGKEQEHQELVTRLLESARDSTASVTLERAAKAALINPAISAANLEQATILTEKAIRYANENDQQLMRWFKVASGMAAYRQGRFADAVTRLTEPASLQYGDQTAIAIPFHSMAYLKQGKRRSAMMHLLPASLILGPVPDRSRVSEILLNHDRLIAMMAYGEAVKLFEARE